MSMFHLIIQKGNIFIIYCFMKRFARNLVKTLWGGVSFPFHHMSLQIAEHLEILDWKEDEDGKEVMSADFIFAHPSSADLLSPLVTESPQKTRVSLDPAIRGDRISSDSQAEHIEEMARKGLRNVRLVQGLHENKKMFLKVH